MMNNVINVRSTLTVSAMSGITTLTVPTFDLYSDGLSEIAKFSNKNHGSDMTSQFTLESNSIEMFSSMNSMTSEISLQNSINEHELEKNLLLALVKRIEESKPLPADFVQIIEDNFWDMI